MSWVLLVYITPSKPPGKRAAVWRELKKLGAVYLRDGVAALPERAETRAAFEVLAGRILNFGGQATLVSGARLEPARHDAIVAQARADRATEYAAIAAEAKRFLEHMASERDHREVTIAELGMLKTDLGKLRTWMDQVRARDHFGTMEGMSAAFDQLECCQQMLAEHSADETRALVTGDSL